MKFDNFNNLLNLLGNLGVIAGVVFLALEIQQSNRIALIEASNEVFANYASFNELFLVNPQLAEIIAGIRRLDQPDEIEEAELDILSAYLKRVFNGFYSTNISFQNGLLSQDAFNALSEDARIIARSIGPAGRIVWRELITEYESFEENEVIGLIHTALDEFDTPR